MKFSTKLIAGLLLAAGRIAAAGEANAPAALPATVVHSESVPTIVENEPTHYRKKPFHNRAPGPMTVTLPDGCSITVIDKHGFPTNAVKPFVVNNSRYEPRVRDIRFVPNSINLPTGSRYGAVEMLPVLHDYSGGFFITPNTPPYR